MARIFLQNHDRVNNIAPCSRLFCLVPIFTQEITVIAASLIPLLNCLQCTRHNAKVKVDIHGYVKTEKIITSCFNHNRRIARHHHVDPAFRLDNQHRSAAWFYGWGSFVASICSYTGHIRWLLGAVSTEYNPDLPKDFIPI